MGWLERSDSTPSMIAEGDSSAAESTTSPQASPTFPQNDPTGEPDVTSGQALSASAIEKSDFAAAAPRATPDEHALAREAEIERLKRQLQDHDERWRVTTALLSNLRPPEAPPIAAKSSIFGPHFIQAAAGALAVIAVVAIGGGIWYWRSALGSTQDAPINLATSQTSSAVPANSQQSLTSAAPAPQARVNAPVLPMTANANLALPSAASMPPGAPVPIPQGTAPAQVASIPPAPSANPPVPVPEPEGEAGSLPPPPDATAPVVHTKASAPVVNQGLTSDLDNYLHHHHQPYVDAVVYSGSSGTAVMVALSGQVRTQKGKDDATVKSEDFLGTGHIRVRNRVSINPELASTAPSGSEAGESAPSAPGPMTGASNTSCTDLCQKDKGYCESHCSNQAVGGASGGLTLGSLLGMGSQMKDCQDNCSQQLDHCVANCSQGGGEMSGSGGPPPPPDSGGPPSGGGGPDQPPDGGPDQPPS